MRALRPILDVVGTIVVALVLLGAFFAFMGGSFAAAVPENVRVLFNFMDVGLGVWAILLIVFSVRNALTLGRAFFSLVVGAVLNLLVVVTVGFVQTGGWAGQLILFAIEAGVACIVAGAIVVPLVHRRAAKAA